MSESSRIRVVIADDLKLQRKMMRAAFESSDEFLLVGEATTGAELVQVAKREKPDLILTDLNMPVLDGAQALRILSFSIPQCVFIVFSGEEDIEKLRPVIAAGASDFLRKPLQMNRLLETVAGIYAREAPRKQVLHAKASDGGTVVSVVGAQAGCGASTLAVNLAVALGHQAQGKVLLLDFDFQTAAATHLLGASGSPGLLEFFQQEESVTVEALRKHLIDCHGIGLLPGAPFPIDAARRDSEILSAMLDVLTPEYEYIVLDLEPRMDEANQMLIGRSSRVYLVASNDATNLRASGRWMAVYNYSHPPPEKARLIYNHARQRGKIPGREVAEAVGLGISGEVIHDGANAQVAAWAGKPVILDGDAPLSKSYRGLFEKLIGKGI